MSQSLPVYASLEKWEEISCMTERATRAAIAAGNLRAVKMGKRVLVHVDSGLSWLSSLPAVRETIAA
jgi:hypothetical protein